MTKNKTRTRNAIQKFFAVILLIAFISGAARILPASAKNPGDQTRTVMLYLDGANLETYWENGTWNLKQVMNADYNENLSFIVVTGGSKEWHTPAEYLDGAEAVDPEYNQIWKVDGKLENEEHGKMHLLGTVPGFEKDSMAKPGTLTAFIDYCYDNFPADLYDIILWDHGGGYVGGFGYDERFQADMNTANLLAAFNNAKLIKDQKKFEIIDFDACLMATVEITAAMSPYTDYLVASVESEPGKGQEYTTWLNAVKQNPNMNGFELGKKIVDALAAFYAKGTDNYMDATLSVINIKNFRERLLPVLTELDNIIISEAKNAGKLNNRYNFYDEIYSVSSAFKYDGGGACIYDLGNLAGVLSAPQSELDNCTDPEINEFKNAYTEVAMSILSILGDRDGSDDDVIYERESECTTQAIEGYTIRGLDGEFLEPDDDGYIRVRPTGLSILFGDSNTSMAQSFIDVVDRTADYISDETALKYIKNRAVAMAYYALIFDTGAIVSELSENGTKYVSWRNVVNYIIDHNNQYGCVTALISCLVNNGEFKTRDEANDYLAQIVAQQAMEALRLDKIRVRRIVKADGSSSYYQVVISNASSQSLMTVISAAALTSNDYSNEIFDMIFEAVNGDKEFDEVYPQGLFYVTSDYDGTLDIYCYYDDYEDEMSDIYRRMYSSPNTVWLVPEMKSYCFALYDSKGNLHPAYIKYIDRAKTKGYVPIQLYFPETGNFGDAFIYIYLEDGVWKVSGVSLSSDTAERSYIPMDSSYFAGAKFATEAWVVNADGVGSYVAMSSFADIDISLEKWGLSFAWVDADETPEIGKVYPYYAVTDVYNYKMDITELFAEADEAAKEGKVVYTIDQVEVTVAEVTYNGQAQRPEVTVKMGDKTLKESIDYKVLYDGSVLPGKAYIAVIGIGDFTDLIYIPYDIKCAAHVLTHNEASNATLEHTGNIEYWQCDYCGKCFSDEEGEHEVTEDELKVAYLNIAGDVNGDGSVDNKDLIRLFRYLSGCDVTVNVAALDINNDDTVNNKDLTRLMQYFCGWDVKIF
ncbi:MAG: hypothetical protein J5852_06810 [Clostridia bacterium]|nr:hypothetical protein [Clostridia bacterium]